MIVAAITGSIGCGKTTLAKIAGNLGYAVFDADSWVRRIYNDKEFLFELNNIFEGIVCDGKADKKKLRKIVFEDNKKLKILEALIHPCLKNKLKKIIRINSKRKGVLFVDAALLFEMKWDKYCDFIIVADVDYNIQKNRVMKRDGITAEDFDKINNVQMKNSDKIKLADTVIDTNKPYNLLKNEMISVIEGLEGALYYDKRNSI
ncbi:MAG: dephospho-CoA kinase [Alphaproteobacteria bacterium]|nr:dephospho-CoA kinase [Alphaproteobacteria bacterium]